jgi:hypothetical protein
MTEPIDLPSLDALRRDREAPAPDDARARVASRLGFPGIPGVRPDSPPAGRSVADAAATAAGRTHVTSLIALAFLAGGAAGALLHARLVPTPAPRVAYVDRPAPAFPSVSLPGAAPEVPVPSVVDRAIPVPSVAGSAGVAVSVIPAASIPRVIASTTLRPGLAQLDAERALLDAARMALVSGDGDTALRALDRHARTYAHPLLGEERDALFVQALVRAGRYDEARTRAEAFRRKVPQSLFRPAVDDAIGSIP